MALQRRWIHHGRANGSMNVDKLATVPGWAEMTRAQRGAWNQRRWRAENPAKAKAKQERDSLERKFRQHGLTLDQYHSMAERQDFLCILCEQEPERRNTKDGREHLDGFVIDHDHQTGKVRGLLCYNCNVGLGMLQDSPQLLEKAARYVG